MGIGTANAIQSLQNRITEETPMSTTPRAEKSKQNELPKDMVELTLAVAKLPSEHRTTIDAILRPVIESTKRRRRILSLVQEALGQLRLDMKYLMFDLEATRRERDEYRERLDEEQ